MHITANSGNTAWLLKLALLVFTLTLGTAKAQSTDQVLGIVARNVVVQFDGHRNLRFCEREQVKGLVCGFEQKLFGHKSFAARDWWTAESYVQAAAGHSNFTILGIEPSPDGNNLTIYFQFH